MSQFKRTQAPAAEGQHDKKKCKYCFAEFIPRREWQEFDRQECRLAYHRSGALGKVKMVELIRKEARRIVREELAAIIREQLDSERTKRKK